jgi:hypothetical protein
MNPIQAMAFEVDLLNRNADDSQWEANNTFRIMRKHEESSSGNIARRTLKYGLILR